MNNELPKQKRPLKTLDERFANRPHTYGRLQEIADQMDQAIANGATADEAEAMAIEQIRKLGGEMLADWAEAKHQQALEQAQSSSEGFSQNSGGPNGRQHDSGRAER
jgi:hypothetical protein